MERQVKANPELAALTAQLDSTKAERQLQLEMSKRLLERWREKYAAQAQVSFQWKNPDFLFRNPDFLFTNPDFSIENVE